MILPTNAKGIDREPNIGKVLPTKCRKNSRRDWSSSSFSDLDIKTKVFICIGTPAMRVKNGEIGCVHTRDNTRDIDIKKAWEFS